MKRKTLNPVVSPESNRKWEGPMVYKDPQAKERATLETSRSHRPRGHRRRRARHNEGKVARRIMHVLVQRGEYAVATLSGRAAKDG